MTCVIYNQTDDCLYRRPGEYSYASYPSLRGAKTALTRIKKTSNKDFVVMYYADWYDQYNPVVTVINRMSGAEVQIRKSDVGTCVDPSTERYWSM